MVNPNRFYTYAYLREDRTPYYIGKGKGKRIYDKRRKVNLPKDKTRIIFLKQNLTEEDAFRHEIYMIAVFGRKDLGTGILQNLTNGGDGTSGWVPSEETRRKISENQKGEKNHNYGKVFSTKTKEKMSENQKGENNNFYGKIHSDDTRRKISETSKGRTHSKESKRKMSEAKKGKIHSYDQIEKFRTHYKKTYYLVSPFGEIIEEYDTMREICKKYDLDQSAFIKVLNKKQKQHKGWTFTNKDNILLKCGG